MSQNEITCREELKRVASEAATALPSPCPLAIIRNHSGLPVTKLISKMHSSLIISPQLVALDPEITQLLITNRRYLRDQVPGLIMTSARYSISILRVRIPSETIHGS